MNTGQEKGKVRDTTGASQEGAHPRPECPMQMKKYKHSRVSNVIWRPKRQPAMPKQEHMRQARRRTFGVLPLVLGGSVDQRIQWMRSHCTNGNQVGVTAVKSGVTRLVERAEKIIGPGSKSSSIPLGPARSLSNRPCCLQAL